MGFYYVVRISDGQPFALNSLARLRLVVLVFFLLVQPSGYFISGKSVTRTRKGVNPYTFSKRAPHLAGSLPLCYRAAGVVRTRSIPTYQVGALPYEHQRQITSFAEAALCLQVQP